ncbi:hypothetical protein [Actinomadura sp. 9N215]|uniref:hypothetical protein n=1 Tax=Actinomadura sp. 9N215 TaxID=3375150 RepID=UPI0037A70C16
MRAEQNTPDHVWSAVQDAPIRELFPGIRAHPGTSHVPRTTAGCTLFLLYPEG